MYIAVQVLYLPVCLPSRQITEVDSLAAQMNAEFDEAEGFELVVE